MQNNFKKIPLIVSILFLLAVALFFFFLYRGVNNHMAEVNETEKKLEAEIARRNEIKALNNYFLSTQGKKNQLETHFVQSSNVVPFLNTLEDLGTGVGVKMKVASIDISRDGTGLLIQLKSTGTFSQVYKFITTLENAPYELEFVSVDLKKEVTEDEESSNQWEANINLRLISFT